MATDPRLQTKTFLGMDVVADPLVPKDTVLLVNPSDASYLEYGGDGLTGDKLLKGWEALVANSGRVPDRMLFGRSPLLDAPYGGRRSGKTFAMIKDIQILTKEKLMTPSHPAILINRVANGWLVSPRREEGGLCGAPVSTTEVARTPKELAALVEKWAREQEAAARQQARPAK